MNDITTALPEKEWFSISEAANHLSMLSGQNVTEADILHYGETGKIWLSHRFTHIVNHTTIFSPLRIDSSDIRRLVQNKMLPVVELTALYPDSDSILYLLREQGANTAFKETEITIDGLIVTRAEMNRFEAEYFGQHGTSAPSNSSAGLDMARDELKPDESQPPGRLPPNSGGRVAIYAAWKIEIETGRPATTKNVMERLQIWTVEGVHSDVLLPPEPGKSGVYWMTTKGKRNELTNEACATAIKKWRESRQ